MLTDLIDEIVSFLGGSMEVWWSYSLPGELGGDPYVALDAVLSNSALLFLPLLVVALICCVLRVFAYFWGVLTGD